MSRPIVPQVQNRYKEIVVFDGLPKNGEYRVDFPRISNVTKVSVCDIVLMFDDNVIPEFPFGLEFALNEGNIKGENRGTYNNKFVFYPEETPASTVLKWCPHRGCTSQAQKAYNNLIKAERIQFKLARYDQPESPTYPPNVRVYIKFSFTCVGWPSNSQVQGMAY